MKRFIPLAILALICSCGKEDNVAPVIEMISPAQNQAFTAGTDVLIKATVTDDQGIHMVHLTVTDINTQGHVVHLEEHLDGKTYDLNKTFPTAAGHQYKIEIGATDHGDNETIKELTVSAN